MTQNNIDQNGIGQQLKEEREYRGFSKQEISDFLGISITQVEEIESNKREIRKDLIEKLMKLYDISLEEWLETGNNEHASKDVDVHTRNIGDLSEKDKEEIRRFVEYLRLSGGSE